MSETPRDDTDRADVIREAAGATPSAGGSDVIAAGAGGSARARTFSAKQVKRARDLLARLYALRRAARFYPSGHPALDQAVDELVGVVAQYHAEGVDVPVTFFEDELLLGEQLLAEDSVLFDQLIRDMTALGIGTLTFHKGLTAEDLRRFVPVIAADPDELVAGGGTEAVVEAVGAPHISVSAVTVVREQPSAEEAKNASKTSYADALDLMRELDRLVRSNQAVSVPRVKSTVRSLIDNVLGNRYAMLELSGLKGFDEYTFYHSVNVAILSIALGSMLSRDYRFLSTLGTGALLHDIGKMTVPLEVLNKPGPLTSEEWALIRQHPVHGAEHAALTPGLDKAAVVIILEHHVRYDLTGYPQTAPPRSQHLVSRLVAVADAYDAMTSRRAYSAARLQDEAMTVLARNAGTALDPRLVRLFIDLMGVYPPRSLVRLGTGEIAVVVSPSAGDPLRPVVRIIAGATGDLAKPIDVDLSAEEAGGRAVERCLDPAGVNIDVADFL